jgi:predicted transcriptional regulator
VLNGGQSNALISKLENAIAKIENGQVKPAVNLLNAFINQVMSYQDDGILTAEQAAALIATAEDIIHTLTG